MIAETLGCLREAGRVAAEARRLGTGLLRPGARLREVCEAVEDLIRRRGAAPAFPVQTSRNHVAAHYCPSPEDETACAEGDLVKLDLGVHVEGWIVDTAQTVNVGDLPANRPLVAAAEHALERAIEAAGPGVAVRRLSEAIAAAIRARGFEPVANLCGHGVDRWTVHCAPPIPNVPEGAGGTLAEGKAVAIEPFATHGRGRVVERGEPEVFRLLEPRTVEDATAAPADERVLAVLRAFRGLPFARRQVQGIDRAELEDALVRLRRERRLMAYPPLVEPTGALIAQAEHTVWVGAAGVEVLTR